MVVKMVINSWLLFLILTSLSRCTVETSYNTKLFGLTSDIVAAENVHQDHGRRQTRSTTSSLFGSDFIANTYGSNGHLNFSGLNSIMSRLRLGRYSVLNTRYQRRNECLTAEQVLEEGGFNSTANLSGHEIDTISSILIQQILKNACYYDSSSSLSVPKEDPGRAWGFAILCVTIISLASMLGAFVVPFMNRDFYQTLLLFMVSLAVGVLCGSGAFHLLPSAFGFGYDGDHTYLWKAAVIVGGIYFFFISENLMKIYIRFSDWKKAKKRRQRRKEAGTDHVPSSPGEAFLDVANTDNMHDIHALDSVHLSDKNCLHEHGMDSLHMAGNHQIDKEDTLEYFVKPVEEEGKKKKKQIEPVAWMIIIGDGLHNFIDGMAIGAAFTSSVLEGVSTSLAIFSEELPHELGDFAILLNSGMSYKQAILCNFLSACTCYVGMVVGILLGRTTSAVKWIYALAAGMFLYISLVDMLPEATGMHVSISGKSKKQTLKTFAFVNFAMILGLSVMFLLALYGSQIKL